MKNTKLRNVGVCAWQRAEKRRRARLRYLQHQRSDARRAVLCSLLRNIVIFWENLSGRPSTLGEALCTAPTCLCLRRLSPLHGRASGHTRWRQSPVQEASSWWSALGCPTLDRLPFCSWSLYASFGSSDRKRWDRLCGHSGLLIPPVL